MKKYTKRTLDMIYKAIYWQDVADKLGVHLQTVYNWRVGNDPLQHRALDIAIKEIVEDKEKRHKTNDKRL